MLKEIDECDREEAVRLLRWLAFAEEPPRLAELAEISTIDHTSAMFYSSDDEIAPHGAWEILTSMVVVNTYPAFGQRREGAITQISADAAIAADISPMLLQVQLAHASIKEYLISDHLLKDVYANFHLCERISNYIMAQVCAMCLLYSYPRLADGASANLPNLFLYAVKYWSTHERKAELAGHKPRLDDTHIKWLDSTELRDDIGECSSLQLASDSGLPKTCEILDASDIDRVDLKQEEACTPLMIAAYKGYLDIVEVLLNKGANIDLIAGQAGTALIVAAEKGREDVVRFEARIHISCLANKP